MTLQFLGQRLVLFGQPLAMGDPMAERPTSFIPHGAPPFVELRFSAYKTATGGEWWRTRQIIRPRLQLVHTNGASGEGSIESAINWGNAASGNTKPHYQVDRWRAAKLVPTDRRAIGNGTVDAYQAGHGDVGEWSIVIETADEGYPTPGENGGFIGDQIEMIAQILAYESITHGIPLEPPDYWWGPGTAAHTEPFGYPYWTIAQGKVCPGRTKKRQLREQVIPRARQVVAEWSTEPDLPPEVPQMTTLRDTTLLHDGPFSGEQLFMVTGDRPVWAEAAVIKVTVDDTPAQAGFVIAWDGNGDWRADPDRRGDVTWRQPNQTPTSEFGVPLHPTQKHTFKIETTTPLPRLVVELRGWNAVA